MLGSIFLIEICELSFDAKSRPRIFFFWIRGNSILRKAHFVGSGERVKPRLSQALTRGARPDSNSRPTV